MRQSWPTPPLCSDRSPTEPTKIGDGKSNRTLKNHERFKMFRGTQPARIRASPWTDGRRLARSLGLSDQGALLLGRSTYLSNGSRIENGLAIFAESPRYPVPMSSTGQPHRAADALTSRPPSAGKP